MGLLRASLFVSLVAAGLHCGSLSSELDRIQRRANGGDQATTPPDVTPPSLLSSVPANLATNVPPCTGSPCRGKIILVFSETMNTSLAQTLTTEIWNGSAYVITSNTNTAFSWSTSSVSNDTLTVNISWYWFPENSQIRFTLAASGFKDTAGNPLAAQIQRSFTTTTAQQSFPLADTGITLCSNATTGITCGSDPLFPTQDGDVLDVPNSRSFSGPTLSGASDYTSTDNRTTLVWKSCNEGRTGSGCTGADTAMDWYTAMNQCSALNLVNYGGRTGWRLPMKRELETLVKLGAGSPAADIAPFPNTTWAVPSYWTATTYPGTSANTWTINFTNGATASSVKTTGTFVARCVSTGTVTPSSFTDNGDGTVTDNVNTLRWQKCSMGQTANATCSGAATTANWSGALQYCDSLNLGTFGNSTNWRLPNGAELRSIIDDSVTAPTMNTTLFPNSNNSWYWTSSTTFFGASSAQQINSSNGTWSSPGKGGAVNVRCVATGP